MTYLWAGYAAKFRAILENDVCPISPHGRVDLGTKNPVVLVKHHSPQLAQPQLLVKVVLTVWHMTGSGSIPA